MQWVHYLLKQCKTGVSFKYSTPQSGKVLIKYIYLFMYLHVRNILLHITYTFLSKYVKMLSPKRLLCFSLLNSW